MITDNLTQLIWDKNPQRFLWQTWDEAITDCNNLADNGVDLTDGSVPGDWHLPNVKEYQSLLDYGFINPSIPDTQGTGEGSPGDAFNNILLDTGEYPCGWGPGGLRNWCVDDLFTGHQRQDPTTGITHTRPSRSTSRKD